MKAPLDSLPPEVFNKIIDNFDNEIHSDWLALSKLRLVNRNICALLTPVVFELVPFWFSLTAFDNLTYIAEHQIL